MITTHLLLHHSCLDYRTIFAKTNVQAFMLAAHHFVDRNTFTHFLDGWQIDVIEVYTQVDTLQTIFNIALLVFHFATEIQNSIFPF